MGTQIVIWLIGLPLAAAPLAYLAGRLAGKAAGPRASALSLAHLASRWVALTALGAAWAPFALAARELSAAGPASFALGAVAFRLDGLSLLFAALALGMATLVALYSGPALACALGEEKYYAILLALVGALIGLACASDLFNLWVWFETIAVASYLLVAGGRAQPLALEASVKYLVQSAAGSTLALLGIALVLAQTGTLDLERIGRAAQPAPTLLAAGALFVAGFGVKAALVPLHAWMPDAYAQAPSGASALFAGVVTKAGLIALLRALGPLAGATVSWGELLMGFGALNMLAGNLLALRQRRLKRLLAYSSLSHLGYIVLGLGIGVYAGQAAGAQGGLFHMLTHGLMSGMAFLAAGGLLYAVRPQDEAPAGGVIGSDIAISDLAGAARRYPLAGLALGLAALGLAGLPPLAGFMSKWQIFVAGFATHSPAVGALVVFAALNSVLSLAYYAPLVNVIYRQRESAAVRGGRRLPAAIAAPLATLALLVVALGVWPALAAWLTEPASSAILSAFAGAR